MDFFRDIVMVAATTPTASPAPVVGPELILNGSFAGDGSPWDTDGTITGGQLLASGGTYALNPISEGGNATYRLVFTIVSISAGGVVASLFDGSGTGTNRTTAGTFSEDIVCSGVGENFLFILDATDAVIDEVSLKEVL